MGTKEIKINIQIFVSSLTGASISIQSQHKENRASIQYQ